VKPNDERRLRGFSCYVEDEMVLFLNIDQIVSWCPASIGHSHVVGGHSRFNETIPTSASLFVGIIDLCRGYCMDFIQTV